MDFEHDAEDARDAALARRAAAGDREALGELLGRHQRWVYGVALRMTRDPSAAADLAQDALLRVITRIAQFEGRAGFRTWAYKIVLRAMLNARRSEPAGARVGFEDYGRFLDGLGAAEEPGEIPPQEWAYLVEETKARCMLGMLLCLDREQRLALILAGVLGVPSAVCAGLLGWTAAAFRKRLERARADLRSFMQAKCGLVDPGNPCRCPKKTAGLVARGLVDPKRLCFAGPAVAALEAEAPGRSRAFEAWAEDAGLRLLRELPLPAGPDLAALLAELLAGFEAGSGRPGGRS
jgi:RNA polymerase sigma factor (sigma-70 family)